MHQLDNYFYKNIVPNYGTGKQIRVYTIKDFRTVNDMILENNLSDINKKSLENIIDRRYKSIVDSNEAKEILNINKIFN